MDLKIITEKENSLFSRKEIAAEIKSNTTPKKSDVEKLLAEKFSTSTEAVKVDRILSSFGSDTFLVYAKIYSSVEEKNSIEPKVKAKTAKAA